MSIALRDGVSRLEVTTRVTLGVLALASGVYTYLGVRDLLNGDATVVFLPPLSIRSRFRWESMPFGPS
jgi:hypothetical protein